MKIKHFPSIVLLFLLVQTKGFAEQGDNNPTGVAGVFNGNITTGCSYDPYTENAHRQIDDIIVPGSVGAYPLKWIRYWNSHTTYNDVSGVGASWRFSYIGYSSNAYEVAFPDGSRMKLRTMSILRRASQS